MKKISFLMLLLLMFSFAIPVHASELDMQNLKVEIEGTNKSIVNLSFEVDSPVEIEEIVFYSDMDGATSEIAYDRSRPNEKVQRLSNGELQENGHYLYHYVIESQSGKIGTFKIRIKYYDYETNQTITQAIHVTNGNPNVAKNVFTPVNALVIGLSATIASVIATFTIIKLSEKNIQLSDEEE